MKSRKKIIKKLALYATFILPFILAFSFILPNVQNYGMNSIKENDFMKTEEFENYLKNEIVSLENDIDWYVRQNADLDVLISNVINGFSRENNIKVLLDIVNYEGRETQISNNQETYEEFMDGFYSSRGFYKCALNEWANTNLNFLREYRFHANQGYFRKLDVYIKIGDFEKNDYLKYMKERFDSFSYLKYVCLIVSILSITAYIILLLSHIKTKKESTGSNFLNRLSSEEILLLIASAVAICIFSYERVNHYEVVLTIAVFISHIVLVEGIILRERKMKSLVVDTIKNYKFTYKIVILYIIVNLLYCFLLTYQFERAIVISILLFVTYTLMFTKGLKSLIDASRIYEVTKNLKEGKSVFEVECYSKECENIIKNLLNIQDGMKEALEKSLKSERLKTALITNVSHDLKTPLTSIINYSDLLKKEKIENEKAIRYIDIIDGKSRKLKELTEELIEASKILSGNEIANLEKIDFREMILQANGEFADKFDEMKFELVSDITKNKIMLDLDGKKLWRAIENLYQNIYKHGLKGTRVYVELKETDEYAIFTIKNVSDEKLNISPDELMERFVVGDASRHSGGNGLGLSISKDLIALNKGELEIRIDGDLFVASVLFKKSK